VAKMLRRNLVGDDRARRALARELEALEELAHPGLARPLDARLDGPYPHIAIEHVSGRTLRRRIRREGALAPDEVAELGLAIAAVLEHIARAGWVHLDVKPGNVVMGPPPRVIDLSLARPVERAQRLSGPVGTRGYMAPEQIHPHGGVGPHTDVWGLGATLHHALSGHKPFSQPRTREENAPLGDRFPQLERDPLPWPAPVPRELGATILACLGRDPARRPTAAELGERLRRGVLDHGGEALPHADAHGRDAVPAASPAELVGKRADQPRA
jgi:eukaryotic-like serine/threonine-protein kinase